MTGAVGSTIQYRVIFDGASGPESGLDLILRANPVVNGVVIRVIMLPLTSTDIIRIAVSHYQISIYKSMNLYSQIT